MVEQPSPSNPCLSHLIPENDLNVGPVPAKVVSQVGLLALLLQYLVAPKVAESMRQKAIMLCRALTTTESASIKSRVRLPGCCAAQTLIPKKASSDWLSLCK